MLFALLDDDIVKTVAELPPWEQRLLAFGSLLAVLIGVVGKVVAAHRKMRRELMADQLQQFERDQAATSAVAALEQRNASEPPPPRREDDITDAFERIRRVERQLQTRQEWDLDRCRAHAREQEAAARRAGQEAAQAQDELLEVRAELRRVRVRLALIERERDELSVRVRLVDFDNAPTDPPPAPKRSPFTPLPTARRRGD